MMTLQIHNLTKRFAHTKAPAVENLSFSVKNGEILALVGPSGCGKTTTLRLIAGLERPDGGSIHLNGTLVASGTVFIPPEKRGVGMVFQDHALFPHLTVFDNVAFGLQGRTRAAIQAIVSEMLTLVGLQGLAGRYPHALSGGERQRVALARALAPRPALLLMDEPFSSLDSDLRLEMREQVRTILKTMQATVLFVTHDQEEALFMGDRLAVFRDGHIEQIGQPEEIFHASATRFVAEFMGDSDFLPGLASSEGIETELGRLPQKFRPHTPVEIAVRADDIDFVPDEVGNAVVAARFFRGAFNLYRLRLDSGHVLHSFKEHTYLLPVGARVRAWVSAEHSLAVFEKAD
ncbi:MAG: ABC transporter ATP-binding protein [Anaerolineae bacterium]|nr:MAG: ABC transporter ATP-binding protein [Anaerolineae bacterium]